MAARPLSAEIEVEIDYPLLYPARGDTGRQTLICCKDTPYVIVYCANKVKWCTALYQTIPVKNTLLCYFPAYKPRLFAPISRSDF